MRYGYRRPSARPRDAQKSKVYAAERVAFPDFMGGSAMLSQTEATEYVRRVWKSPWTRREFQTARMYSPPRVIFVGERRWARGSLSLIKLPNWGMHAPVILHEIAHGLAGSGHRHDRVYCACFTALVQHFLGVEQAKALKAAFKQHKVKYKLKRKLGPGAMERLRERGRKLAALRHSILATAATGGGDGPGRDA